MPFKVTIQFYKLSKDKKFRERKTVTLKSGMTFQEAKDFRKENNLPNASISPEPVWAGYKEHKVFPANKTPRS